MYFIFYSNKLTIAQVLHKRSIIINKDLQEALLMVQLQDITLTIKVSIHQFVTIILMWTQYSSGQLKNERHQTPMYATSTATNYNPQLAPVKVH